MPQVVLAAWFVGSTVLTSLGVATAGIALTFAVGAATFAVVGYGIKRSLSLRDPAQMGRSASYQVAVRGTQEPRTKCYGQAKVGGVISYANSTGINQSELYIVVAHTAHEIDSFLGWFVDEKFIDVSDVDTAGDGSVDGDTAGTGHGLTPFAGTPVCYLRGHLGSMSQTVDTMLSGAFSEWDSGHTGAGICYTVFRGDLLAGAEGRWDGQYPQSIMALIKGAKVYDPRLDSTFTGANYGSGSGSHRLNDPTTWAWSDNPALCLADYLIDADLGPGWATARIDYDSVAVAADDCDELVPIPTSATQKRFTCNGVLTTAESCEDNIAALCTAGVKLRYYKGQWHIFADVWVAPSLALTKEDLIGGFTFRAEPEREDRYNTVKGSYLDPARNYERSPFIQVTSSLKSSRDNDRELVKELWLPFTNNEYEAQRIAFRALNQASETGICTYPVGYQAMNARIGDNVTVTLDEVGWAPESFRVVGWRHLDFQGIELTLKEDDSSAYDDPAEGDYGTRTAADEIVFPRISPALVDTPFIATDAATSLAQSFDAGPFSMSGSGPIQGGDVTTFVAPTQTVGCTLQVTAIWDEYVGSIAGSQITRIWCETDTGDDFSDEIPVLGSSADPAGRQLKHQFDYVGGDNVTLHLQWGVNTPAGPNTATYANVKWIVEYIKR